MNRLTALLTGPLVLALTTSVLAAASKPAAAVPPLQGVVADVTKDKVKNGGTLTVKVNGNLMTFTISAGTRFEYANGVSTWGTNFFEVDHVGKKVAVFVRAGSNPPAAAKVQILLPRPKPSKPGPPPPPPKPTRVFGKVTSLADGHITIKLPNYTPPPPVTGNVTDLSLDDVKGYGTITVTAKGKKHKFWVNSGTFFQTLGKKHQHWQVGFLSIHDGEHVKVFPRYGHPHLAGTVDILLKGSKAPPAIIYKDQFLKFQQKPLTKYELVRDGKHKKVPPSAVAVGEEVGILPHGLHSHVAENVEIVAPGSIHGRLVSSSGSAITVKIHHGKGKGAGQTKTVAVNGSTQYRTVQGKASKPAASSSLKPGQHLVIARAAPPSHAAEMVEIHPPKPQSIQGTVVSSSGGKLAVKTGKGVKHFTLGGSTKLEAQEGKKSRAAKPADLKPGTKVMVVALDEPPHLAQKVQIHVAPKHAGKSQSIQGTVVSSGGGKLTVKAGGGVKHFTMNSSTKLEAHEGKKSRAAKPAELKPGAKVMVVALNEPPHVAQKVQIQVAGKTNSAKKDKDKSGKKDKDKRKPKPKPAPKPKKKK